MAKPIQFSIYELMAAMVVASVAAWLVSVRLGILIPAMIAMVIGFAYRNKSDYPLPLIIFGGAGIGIALTTSAMITSIVFGHSQGLLIGRYWHALLLVVAIAWAITWIIFLQFRKMIVRPLPKRKTPVDIDGAPNRTGNGV